MVEPTPAAHSGDKRLWRVVGRVGQGLIALGVLMLLFVGYQLWGTGLQYSRAQHALRSEFENAAAPATTTTAASTTTAPPASTTTAPTATTTTTTTALAEPDVVEGDVLARLEIPRLDETTYIIAGVSVADLRKGPGHFPDTALPGQLGNAVIAGHRTTYGAPFARINELQPGDQVVLTTRSGQRYVYSVSAEPFVVAPTGVDVLADTPGHATLTLISCHPKYTARNRIVVQAALDPVASPPPAARTAPYSADTPPPRGSGPTATTAPTAEEAPGPTVLTSGWFTDGGAWWGVVLWGVALVAATAGAWWIGRRYHRWIGALAMLVPFAIFLYFFFENVNRLLPANL
jgi:sortase A